MMLMQPMLNPQRSPPIPSGGLEMNQTRLHLITEQKGWPPFPGRCEAMIVNQSHRFFLDRLSERLRLMSVNNYLLGMLPHFIKKI
jgi:hypothetical protein